MEKQFILVFEILFVEKFRKYRWFLYHINCQWHTSFVVQQILTDKKIPTILRLPYLPDLAPYDFWLFPNLKLGLKGFALIEDIKVNLIATHKTIPTVGYQRYFQQLGPNQIRSNTTCLLIWNYCNNCGIF